ncbi:MAG TPA: hypothetical protein VFD58_32140 [Blastocatellia bacterium]|nr:hypothetical protein [Blastocatellia bacterium]
MKFRHLFPFAAPAVLLALSLLFTPVQSARAGADDKTHRPETAKATGIISDRIPARQMQKWQAIEKLVLAEDPSGQPLHPTLRSLYEWAESGGHAIYIELITRNSISNCTAGHFSIERFDPKGVRHEAVIRLYLSNIDQAWIGESTARDDRFIPFRGLKKEERYAEVLGHELAHAVDILSDLEKARKVEELVEQTNEMLLDRQTRRGSEELTPDLKERLTSRDSLLKQLEERASTLEAAVWRELTASLTTRGRSPEVLASNRL